METQSSGISRGLLVVGIESGSRLIAVAATLVFAALLSPAEFGIAAIALLVYAAAIALADPGLTALIQTLSRSEETDRALLGASLMVGSLAAGLVAVGAFPMANVLGEPAAAPLIVALAPAVLVRRWAESRRALIERENDFGFTSGSHLAATALGAGAAVAAAAAGAGAWSFVVQVLVMDGVWGVGMTLRKASVRRPYWPLATLKRSWKYSRDLIGSNILVFVYTNIDDVAVSRLLGASQLGGYTFAYRICSFPTYTVAHSLNRVLVPAYRAKHQLGLPNAPTYRQTLRVTSAAVGFMMGIVIVHGPTLIEAMYGPTWNFAFSALQVLALYGLIRTVGAVSGATLVAHQRPDILRRVALWQTIAMLLILWPTVARFGILGAALATTLPMAVGVGVAVKSAARLVDLAPSCAFRDIAIGGSLSAGSILLAWPLTWLVTGWGGSILAVGVSSALVLVGSIRAFRGEILGVIGDLRRCHRRAL